MTSSTLPTPNELTTAIKQIRNERVNTQMCNTLHEKELEQVTSHPPDQLVICKDGSRSLVGRHTLSDGTECILKYYYPRNLAKKINYGIRGSRCMRSWVAARVFSLLDIPTAPAMMIAEQRGLSGMTLKQSFLACHVASGSALSDTVEEASHDETLLHTIAKQLKHAFETMASYRISHGDLKANNIIVDTQHKIRFIDLDGTTILSSTKQWKELWKRDRKRFLKNWPADSLPHQIFAETITPM